MPGLVEHLPNALTGLRLALAAPIALLYLLPWPGAQLAALILFALAALSDAVDGALARHLQRETAFGAFLDPVADKILVATGLILVATRLPELAVVTAVLLLISRELGMVSLRAWLAERGASASANVSWLAKSKTALQMAALVVLLPLGVQDGTVMGSAHPPPLETSVAASAELLAEPTQPTPVHRSAGTNARAAGTTLGGVAVINAGLYAQLKAIGLALLWGATLVSLLSFVGYWRRAQAGRLGR